MGLGVKSLHPEHWILPRLSEQLNNMYIVRMIQALDTRPLVHCLFSRAIPNPEQAAAFRK